MTIAKKHWQAALTVQTACNLASIVKAFDEALEAIIKEDRDFIGRGTNWRNTHPIAVLFSTQIGSLTKTCTLADPDVYSKASDACKLEVLLWEKLELSLVDKLSDEQIARLGQINLELEKRNVDRLKVRLGYDVLNVFQRYWCGQGDHLYAVLSRRGNSVDFVTLDASLEEVDRLEEVANYIIENSGDEAEVRVAKRLLENLLA